MKRVHFTFIKSALPMAIGTLTLAICLFLFPPIMYSQPGCESGEGEKFEYEKLTTLCEQYGGQTPTITITDGFATDYPSGEWNNEVVYISGEFTINTADFDILNTTIEMGARCRYNRRSRRTTGYTRQLHF